MPQPTLTASPRTLTAVSKLAAGRPFRLLCFTLAASHLAVTVGMGRTRPEHVLADALLAALPWFGSRGEDFAQGILPVWLAAILHDSQWALHGLRGTIHTGDLLALDRAFFPSIAGQSWPEWFAQHHTPALDLLAGFGYATYLLELLGVALFLFWKTPGAFRAVGWAFLLTNVVGIAGYLFYPAAPPWYVLAHGPGPADLLAAPSAAGAARFDALLGIEYFHSFYGRNPNVFGAMPSLHAAYPVIAVWFTWRRGWAWRAGTTLYAGLIAFSAVYLTHHYVMDVLVGVVVALAACHAVTRATAQARAAGAEAAWTSAFGRARR